MAQEIIVYLDDYKYSGDGNYDTMYLDFRTKKDFAAYVRELGMKEPTRGSYLQIEGYRSPKRLTRGAYYALNVDMLKQLKPEPIQESLIFAHSYIFNNYAGKNDDTFHLLQAHELLDPDDLATPHHNRIENLEDVAGREYLKFCVNDVSQANWNEVLDDSAVLYVFDIGAPIHAKATDVQSYIDNYAHSYSNDKPVLILSHWDIDHYHCLLQMSEAAIKANFSKFICPDKIKSNTSQQVFDKMEKALGSANVHSVLLHNRTADTAYPLMHQEYGNQGIRLYAGERSRNVNYSGLVLYVEGTKGNVILTGDCLPVQASDVLAYSTANLSYEKEHYLVVPHHGGDFKSKKIYKTYIIPTKLKPKEAIISVDETNNTYGHPTKEMINFLKSVANWNITRTDKGNVNNPYKLSFDLLEDRRREHERELTEKFIDSIDLEEKTSKGE